uniref:Uncharacterized protein n=1 Tax=Anguilla anguilla TaxID=7936 RepID=A0A0E9V012_ANGAN
MVPFNPYSIQYFCKMAAMADNSITDELSHVFSMNVVQIHQAHTVVINRSGQ